VFVRYRRDEAADAADRIRHDLVAHRPDLHVFVDVHSIVAGRDYAAVIAEELEGADACLALIGPDWVEDRDRRRRLEEEGDYVRLELEAALGRGIPVLPVLIHNAALPVEGDLPESLRPLLRRQAIVLSRDYWSAGIERLVDFLEIDGQPPVEPAPPPRAARRTNLPTRPARLSIAGRR
jgi:hypothetical protein